MSTGVTAPAGFKAAGVACGIKPKGADMAMVAADAPAAVAAVFTTNLAQAAPVVVSREHVASGRARAVVVNAGCANAATGAGGLADARAMAALAARELGCDASEVVVASTGVIGVPLPMARVAEGIPAVVRALRADGGAEAARAILTTDTHPKETVALFSLRGRTARVGGMAKGAGMIAPNMATLLAFFTTDAPVAPPALQRALVEAVGSSLNRITVDGDTSTNDMAVVLASGALGGAPLEASDPEWRAFADALAAAARTLALMIVRDGEGASRIASVEVTGARTDAEADRIARTVAESPLVKTALCGGDPNWGRILAAAGRAGVPLDMSLVGIRLGDVHVAEGGAARAYDEEDARRAVHEDPVRIRVEVGGGSGRGHVWTCDFGHGYVDVNAHYRS